jgi:PAS domain-containing protein
VQAREELARSELCWQTMTDALLNLVWTDLPNGECDWLSSQWGKYTGIPEQELLGLNWLDKVIHPDDRERSILVVDDNRDAAESLAIALRFLGHEVAAAHDGLQAVETVSTFQPDVAFQRTHRDE